jgi:hypothetical protein
MLEVPDGESISVQLEEKASEEDLKLTGDVLKAFKAGIIVASNIFAELPFSGVLEEVPASEDAAASGN